MHLSRSKRLLGAGATLIVLAVVGLAYAAWVADGTGNGYAKAGTSNAVSTAVIATGSVPATLYPGVDGDLKITVTNSNPYPVKVTDVDQTASSTITSDNATCDTNGNGVVVNTTALENAVTPTTGAITVAAKSGGVDGSSTATLAGVVHMNNTSDNACQGARFAVPVDLAANSNATP